MMNYGELEGGKYYDSYNEGVEKSLTVNLRLGFIRKVYGILSTQLIFTALMCFCSMYFTNFLKFQLANIWLFYLCLIVTFVIIFALLCFYKAFTEVPTNYILLGIFTLSEAYMVSLICGVYDPQAVFLAAAMTAAITLSLTLYACTTKTDFTVYWAALWVVGTGFLLFMIFGLIFPNRILELIICVGAIILFGMYLIFDTQLIAGGRRYQLDYDEYIIGALMIYVDIIGLFLRLLELLSILRRN